VAIEPLSCSERSTFSWAVRKRSSSTTPPKTSRCARKTSMSTVFRAATAVSVQGYLFSRPVPADAVARLLASSTRWLREVPTASTPAAEPSHGVGTR